MAEHEWTTVHIRRWCLCCDAYQQWSGLAWVPRVIATCPMTTTFAYARKLTQPINLSPPEPSDNA